MGLDDSGGGALVPGRYQPDNCDVLDMGGGVMEGRSLASRNALANGLCLIFSAVTSSFW